MQTLKRFVQAYNVFLFPFFLLSLQWMRTILFVDGVCLLHEGRDSISTSTMPWWLFHFRIFFVPICVVCIQFTVSFILFFFSIWFLCKYYDVKNARQLIWCLASSRVALLLSTNHHWNIVSKISRGSKRHCIIINSLWEWTKKTTGNIVHVIVTSPCSSVRSHMLGS